MEGLSERPFAFADVEACVESTIARIGRRIHLGAPLGLGKANHLVNEFFRRARQDSRLELRISTALTLGKPRGRKELERRFLQQVEGEHVVAEIADQGIDDRVRRWLGGHSRRV